MFEQAVCAARCVREKSHLGEGVSHENGIHSEELLFKLGLALGDLGGGLGNRASLWTECCQKVGQFYGWVSY